MNPSWSACPLCQRYNHACSSRTSNQRCSNCNQPWNKGHMLEGIPFPQQEIERQFHDRGWVDEAQSLASSADHVNTLHLLVKTLLSNPQGGTSPDPPEVEFRVTFHGPIHEHNKLFIECLEKHVYMNFSPQLKDKVPNSDIVSLAATVGGLLHMLCSTRKIFVTVQEFTGAGTSFYRYNETQLRLSFGRVLLWRIKQIIDKLIAAIRLGYPDCDDPLRKKIAYATAAILYSETSYFRDFLKSGPSSDKIPLGLDGAFLGWLASLDNELRSHLREGCGKFSDWRSVIHGSMKKVRRHHETLHIKMGIQQIEIGEQTALSENLTLKGGVASTWAERIFTSMPSETATYKSPYKQSPNLCESVSGPRIHLYGPSRLPFPLESTHLPYTTPSIKSSPDRPPPGNNPSSYDAPEHFGYSNPIIEVDIQALLLPHPPSTDLDTQLYTSRLSPFQTIVPGSSDFQNFGSLFITGANDIDFTAPSLGFEYMPFEGSQIDDQYFDFEMENTPFSFGSINNSTPPVPASFQTYSINATTPDETEYKDSINPHLLRLNDPHGYPPTS